MGPPSTPWSLERFVVGVALLKSRFQRLQEQWSVWLKPLPPCREHPCQTPSWTRTALRHCCQDLTPGALHVYCCCLAMSNKTWVPCHQEVTHLWEATATLSPSLTPVAWATWALAMGPTASGWLPCLYMKCWAHCFQGHGLRVLLNCNYNEKGKDLKSHIR